MLITVAVCPLAVGGAYLFMYLTGAPLRLHLALSLAAGISLSLILAGALMGLLFLSSRSGADAAAAEFQRDEDDL
jgi:hypothetical protein